MATTTKSTHQLPKINIRYPTPSDYETTVPHFHRDNQDIQVFHLEQPLHQPRQI